MRAGEALLSYDGACELEEQLELFSQECGSCRDTATTRIHANSIRTEEPELFLVVSKRGAPIVLSVFCGLLFLFPCP